MDQAGASLSDRLIAFIDKNCDVFLARAQSHMTKSQTANVKLGAMATDLRFNDEANMLAVLQDDRLLIYTYPPCAFTDVELLPRTVITRELKFVRTKITHISLSDSKSVNQLTAYTGSRVSVSKLDGSTIALPVSPFALAVHDCVRGGKWDNALKLCRHVNDDALWAQLAALASAAKNTSVALVAFGAINEAEKVTYLTEVERAGNQDVKSAQLIAAQGNIDDGERMFMQAGNQFRAIMLNVMMYRWSR